jgi:glycerate 2-kinase
MLSADSFWTRTLHEHPQGEAITHILAAAIQAVDPGEAVRRHVHLEGDTLTISGRSYDLASYQRIVLLAFGKASVPMTQTLHEILGSCLSGGLVITKHIRQPASESLLTENQKAKIENLKVLLGDHPVPGPQSLAAGKAVLDFLSQLSSHDLLICLISGGASALLAAPPDFVTLEDLQQFTSALLECGASIQEINLLRRRLDRLKGGGMACLANGATILSLILSDVVGNPLEVIASGPTAPDPSTSKDVLALLRKYSLQKALPASILSALETAPETPKPASSLFQNVHNLIVGSSLQAAQAALRQAAEAGFHPYLLELDRQGDARQAAVELSTFLRQTKQTGEPVPAPACIVSAGETTVTLRGNGRGGRNTELALSAAVELASFPNVMLVSLATDGEDGPTCAAGGVATGETFARGVALGMQPADYLMNNDSYSFFERLDDLLKPGPTGTNVNDLTLLFTF